MAIRYAQNNMAPIGQSKTDMILTGTNGVVAMKLSSSDLMRVLARVMKKFMSRYEELDPLEEDKAKAEEELRGRQALLEGHGWLIDILSDALQNDLWKARKDPYDADQKVETKLEVVDLKRKSECSEYGSLSVLGAITVSDYRLISNIPFSVEGP
ncbi:hypothetical protein CPB85DRAFT_1352235 [Mucidula mucida]|nr:hypothetical protein CPB85DRAFT_1352235 [Mucidula mucida]